MPGAYVLHLNEHLDLDTTTMVCRTCRKSKNVQAFPTVTNAGGHSQDPTDHRWHRGTECRDCQAERRQKPHQVTADDLISEARTVIQYDGDDNYIGGQVLATLVLAFFKVES